MRVSTNAANLEYTIFTYRTRTGVVLQNTTSVVTLETKRLERSDVVRNAINSTTGWQQMSPYYVRDTLTSWETGYRQVETSYSDPGDWKYDLTSRTSGFQNLGFTSVVAANYQASSNTVNRCEVQALLKIRDSKVNWAVALAETHKSVDMIASRLTSIVRSYSALRKGNIKGAAKALGITTPKKTGGGTANTWLEMQYGWLPMLSDIHGSYLQMQEGFKKHGLLMKAISRQSESGNNDFQLYQGDAGKARVYDKYKADCQVVLWYEVDNPAVLQASATGLLNPSEVLWELVPFSFVVDWIIPVGDFLGALTASYGLNFKGGTLTMRTRATRELKWTNNPPYVSSDHTTVYSGEVQASSSDFLMNRSLYLAPPFPTPYVKNPFSVGHGLNALALLRALF